MRTVPVKRLVYYKLKFYFGDTPFNGIGDAGDHLIYFKDGDYHRIDGPAIIWDDGHQEWYCHGKLHREDGPAIELKDGTNQWWFHGFNYVDIDNWGKHLGILDTEDFVMMKLKWG